MPAAASSRIRLLSVCIILSYFASRNDLSQPGCYLDATNKINLELPYLGYMYANLRFARSIQTLISVKFSFVAR